MQINCGTLVNLLHTDFPKAYKNFSRFVGSGPLWDEVCTVMSDKSLLSHIVFCNDVMKLQPVYTHVMISKYLGGEVGQRVFSSREEDWLTDWEKRSLGAAYGYLFRFVLGYPKYDTGMRCALPNFRTAAIYFREDKTPVEFLNGEKELNGTLK